jgi:hypothetical protein
MKLDPITVISSFAGVLSLGAVGAFFLYVSPITILSVVATLTAILIMFALGVVWGMESGQAPKQDRPEEFL